MTKWELMLTKVKNTYFDVVILIFEFGIYIILSFLASNNPIFATMPNTFFLLWDNDFPKNKKLKNFPFGIPCTTNRQITFRKS